MLLVIDIGNSNLVLGVFQGETLVHAWRAATRRDQTADEYAVLCRNFFGLENLQTASVEDVVISSVVPPLNECFDELSRKYFSRKPIFVDPEGQRLMPVRYSPPSDVGADRIVNAIAAYQLYGGPAVVVDFGTATTFDVVSEPGEYLGGIISPGVGISAEALFARTAKLPRIDLRRPPSVVGTSTVTSMQSGIFFGYIGLVDGILERIEAELGPLSVTATGGLSRLIGPESKKIDRIEENLTLYGLKFYYQHHVQKQPLPKR